MKRIVAVALFTAVTGACSSAEPTAPAGEEQAGAVVEWAGMKSAAPKEWKEVTPSSTMRKAQLAVFQPPAGKDKVDEKQEKVKVGPNDGVLQEVGGTFLKKAGGPFDPNAKTTPVAGYRQVYVVFETKDGITASAWLRGPEKTVEKHKPAFVAWVRNFK